MGAIETFFRAGRWRNREQGKPGFLSSHATAREAIAWGQHLAVERRSDHVIRDENDNLVSRTPYGEYAG